MSSHNVILSNIIPLDLNFLLYTNNVYSNFYTDKLSFPGIGCNYNGLLPYNDFLEVMNKCWISLLDKYSSPYSILIYNGLSIQDEYSSLFLDNDAGRKKLNQIWEDFNHWWWPDYGIMSFLERISDLHVVKIAEEISTFAKENIISISDQQLSLLMVFQPLPERLKQRDSHIYVAHLSELFERSTHNLSYSMFKSLVGN